MYSDLATSENSLWAMAGGGGGAGAGVGVAGDGVRAGSAARAAVRDASVVKIAVQLPPGGDKVPLLTEFNQRLPLTAIVQELCHLWGITDPEHYALQFSEHNNRNYVTEKNRKEVKNGSVLTLGRAAGRVAEEIVARVKAAHASPEQREDALARLADYAADPTFAQEFINKKGHDELVAAIEGSRFHGAALGHALTAFSELMEHGQISWDVLEDDFVRRVAGHVEDATQDRVVVKACLSILENVALNATDEHSVVERAVDVPTLIAHLKTDDQVVQQNVIALVNALLLKADADGKRRVHAALWSKEVRNVLLCNAVRAPSEVGTEMAHQLYVLQTHCLSLLVARTGEIDRQDADALDKIKELRRIAFENDVVNSIDVARRQPPPSKDYKKLGFKNDVNPISDFAEEHSPGALALDCMLYFAKYHVQHYTKVVLENSCRVDEHECPFGRTSIELVKSLIEILRIRESPSEQGQMYYPMIFAHDRPFEELFCICIRLLNKTWKEMRATTEDFVKVFSVVREQITRALATFPMNMDKFDQKLQQLTYSEIRQIWQQERNNREEWESHARPIVELKEKLMPEIMDLIKQQRLGLLVNGQRFTKYTTKGLRSKDKFWFVRLSPNHKFLHYGDCDEKSTPSLEELGSKIAVSDIKNLSCEKDCANLKDKNRKPTAFSVISESDPSQTLDFVAPDEQTFDYWTDGINALLGNKMVSKTCENDSETLISMDIKLRLLDTEGIDIPQDPPVIPPPPDNYDFFYDVK